ncbi:glycosyl transferase, partial [Nadsonia fulvescens var. elongata DSM 6958]
QANATFITLARNSELEKLLPSIRSVEDRFNKKFHYDWVFLNEEEFSQEFIDAVSPLVSGKARFGIIPEEHWGYPEWIDKAKADDARKKLAEANVNYGGLESYRHMCRFQSGFFFHHPIMQEYRYYWRVEPETSLRCDIEYDVFQYMQTHNKKYGFTISITEFESTIPSLWNTTKEFVKQNPELIPKDNLLKFVSNDDGESYNLCHFWSNFEIADAEFWRGNAYSKYFEFLDKKGGFFYERWGDAPVHSIGASLFLPKEQIHFFGDIGYTHPPFSHCPTDSQALKELKCDCTAKQSFDWVSSSCLNKFYQARDIPLPDDWK